MTEIEELRNFCLGLEPINIEPITVFCWATSINTVSIRFDNVLSTYRNRSVISNFVSFVEYLIEKDSFNKKIELSQFIVLLRGFKIGELVDSL